LGINRFYNELDKFEFLQDEIFTSMDNKVEIFDYNPYLVYPVEEATIIEEAIQENIEKFEDSDLNIN
jgi:hypothetical protein